MSTSIPSTLFAAVPVAVLGAASFGLASAMQQRAAREVPHSSVIGPGLLVELARRPTWLLATGAVLLGLAMQVVALAFAPLILVQPLLVTGILFGTLFAAWLAHRRPDRAIIIGAVAATVGLAAFLALARPTGGTAQLPGISGLLPLTLLLVGSFLGCLLIAVRFTGMPQVAALAVATGICYGVTAGLMKVVTSTLRTGGPEAVLLYPAFWVVCVVGPLGFLLSQHAFQQGVLIAPALAVITIVDPLVATAMGLMWLGEELADTSPPVVAGQAIAGALLIFGVGVLAHRGTQLRAEAARLDAHSRGW